MYAVVDICNSILGPSVFMCTTKVCKPFEVYNSVVVHDVHRIRLEWKVDPHAQGVTPDHCPWRMHGYMVLLVLGLLPNSHMQCLHCSTSTKIFGGVVLELISEIARTKHNCVLSYMYYCAPAKWTSA